LSLLLIAGGVVLEAQLHRAPIAPAPSPGPVPKVPNEIVELLDPSQGSGVVLPLRLRDSKVLPPRAQWLVAPGTAVMLSSGGICDQTVIHIVDLGSPPHDTRAPVTLPDCYDTPVMLPGSEMLLAHFQRPNGNRFVDLGAVRYDWAAGRVTRTYPTVSFPFVGGLASADGTLLYTLTPDFCNDCALDITDLRTGARLAHVQVYVSSPGFTVGGMALSLDGQTLYLNEGDGLATFDAKSGRAGAALTFNQRPTANSTVPGWLPSMTDADAKEGLGPGRGLVIDPQGRWVAALGADNPHDYGIWVISASAPAHVLRGIEAIAGLVGVGVSRDGSVLYALDRQGALYVLDPQTGRLIKRLVIPRIAGLLGIAGVDAAP